MERRQEDSEACERLSFREVLLCESYWEMICVRVYHSLSLEEWRSSSDIHDRLTPGDRELIPITSVEHVLQSKMVRPAAGEVVRFSRPNLYKIERKRGYDNEANVTARYIYELLRSRHARGKKRTSVARHLRTMSPELLASAVSLVRTRYLQTGEALAWTTKDGVFRRFTFEVVAIRKLYLCRVSSEEDVAAVRECLAGIMGAIREQGGAFGIWTFRCYCSSEELRLECEELERNSGVQVIALVSGTWEGHAMASAEKDALISLHPQSEVHWDVGGSWGGSR